MSVYQRVTHHEKTIVEAQKRPTMAEPSPAAATETTEATDEDTPERNGATLVNAEGARTADSIHYI